MHGRCIPCLLDATLVGKDFHERICGPRNRRVARPPVVGNSAIEPGEAAAQLLAALLPAGGVVGLLGVVGAAVGLSGLVEEAVSSPSAIVVPKLIGCLRGREW